MNTYEVSFSYNGKPYLFTVEAEDNEEAQELGEELFADHPDFEDIDILSGEGVEYLGTKRIGSLTRRLT